MTLHSKHKWVCSVPWRKRNYIGDLDSQQHKNIARYSKWYFYKGNHSGQCTSVVYVMTDVRMMIVSLGWEIKWFQHTRIVLRFTTTSPNQAREVVKLLSSTLHTLTSSSLGHHQGVPLYWPIIHHIKHHKRLVKERGK